MHLGLLIFVFRFFDNLLKIQDFFVCICNVSLRRFTAFIFILLLLNVLFIFIHNLILNKLAFQIKTLSFILMGLGGWAFFRIENINNVGVLGVVIHPRRLSFLFSRCKTLYINWALLRKTHALMLFAALDWIFAFLVTPFALF